MKIEQLCVYPIKSLGGIQLETAEITKTGFAYDRYWMLVDENGNCLTQRDYPILALFRLNLLEEFISIKYEGEELKIAKKLAETEEKECIIWGNSVATHKELAESSEWFSEKLKAKVYLVRKAPEPKRLVRKHPDASVNFSDSNQYLILGEQSLVHLNSKLETPVPMDRFRPNIVFSGGTPHIEDQWHSIQINDSIFEVTKPCARCNLTTINQETAEVGTEPLLTLSRYRRVDRKVLFGQYLKAVKSDGTKIRVGEELHLI